MIGNHWSTVMIFYIINMVFNVLRLIFTIRESEMSNSSKIFSIGENICMKIKRFRLLISVIVIVLLFPTLNYFLTSHVNDNLNSRHVVLVTGAAGFVGSHLSAKLLKQNSVVYGVDNLSTGQKQNVKWLQGMGDFHFIEKDVTDMSEYSFIKLAQIYHLASPASPKAYLKDPIGTYRANTIGTDSMVNLARKYNARLLFASSSEVYGDAQQHPQTENYWGNVNTYGPRACYDESKRMGETICYIAQEEYEVDVRIARIFNTYGPRMHPNDGRIISNFIVHGLNGQPISIYGDGTHTRSFLYVSDLIQGLIQLMESDVNIPINIGNPHEEHNVLKVANIIQNLLEEVGIEKTEIVYTAALEDDPTRRRPDISKAEELIHWRPLVSFEEGLRKTINHFRRN